MDAVISGRVGKALLLEGDSLSVFDVDDLGTLVPVQPSDFHLFFGDALDLRFIEDTNAEAVAQALKFEHVCACALDLTLISLDPKLSTEVRTEAVAALEELLADSYVAEYLTNIFYAMPLPPSADVAGALKCGAAARAQVFGDMLRILESYQQEIREVRLAWDAIPRETFAGDGQRVQFQHFAVHESFFRTLVLARSSQQRINKFWRTYVLNTSAQVTPNYREIMEQWLAPLLFHPGALNAEEQKTTVLVVEDDHLLRRQLQEALSDSYRVPGVETMREAVEVLRRERVDVIICDIRPSSSSTSTGHVDDVLRAAHEARPAVPVIVMTASPDSSVTREAVRGGAFGFFQKPFDLDEVSHIVAQAARMRRLEAEVLRLRSGLELSRGFGRFVGSSPALERVLKQARAVAGMTATVLVTGENGTGKEVLARAIHEESSRRDRPFVTVSCAALDESLIEDELFGHEKGAFTGAFERKKGRVELAEGGTLFLDEIGELNPTTQFKLLRVLQERSFWRVGGTRPVKADVRLIAASNHDLDIEVRQGRFRADLFYRLNVVPLHLPALRERREDVPALAAYFAVKASEKHGHAVPALDPDLIDVLVTYDWPGNVRELENLIERLVVLTRDPVLRVDYLPDKMVCVGPIDSGRSSPPAAPGEDSLESAMHALKRRMVAAALQAEHGDRAAAARRLGISRSYLGRLMDELEA